MVRPWPDRPDRLRRPCEGCVFVGVNESRGFVVLAATVHDLILVAAVYMVLRNSSLGRKSACFKIVGRGLPEVYLHEEVCLHVEVYFQSRYLTNRLNIPDVVAIECDYMHAVY